MSVKYGIKVPILKDDWVWVTHDQLGETNDSFSGFGQIHPLLFEDIWEAEEVAEVFGPLAEVREYKP